MALQPRAVVVHRRSEYQELLMHHGTHRQAEFFLRSRDRDIAEVRERDQMLSRALQLTMEAVPLTWRRARVERADIARFAFEAEDVIIAVGQDGLVANVAKYLTGQPVVGINPDPALNPGILVPHPPEVARELVPIVGDHSVIEERTMVAAQTDDGQRLIALNELYVGHASHQSARYVVAIGDRRERQSSSGLLVGTGTGATGWLRSVWGERHSDLALPGPSEPVLLWFIREAWPSVSTGTSLTEGRLTKLGRLSVTAESDRLVCFGDGIESDALTLTWGQRLMLERATERLRLVVG